MKIVGLWIKRLLALAVLLFLLYQLWVLGCLLWWTRSNPGNTRFMDLRLSELRLKKPEARLQQQWVP
jgi:monofunctional biosynthetic peptidoglycan transglycosylase